MEGIVKQEGNIKEEKVEGNFIETQEDAQRNVVNMFKPAGMFGAGEMVVGGEIKSIEKVMDHGVEYSRF